MLITHFSTIKIVLKLCHSCTICELVVKRSARGGASMEKQKQSPKYQVQVMKGLPFERAISSGVKGTATPESLDQAVLALMRLTDLAESAEEGILLDEQPEAAVYLWLSDEGAYYYILIEDDVFPFGVVIYDQKNTASICSYSQIEVSNVEASSRNALLIDQAVDPYEKDVEDFIFDFKQGKFNREISGNSALRSLHIVVMREIKSIADCGIRLSPDQRETLTKSMKGRLSKQQRGLSEKEQEIKDKIEIKNQDRTYIPFFRLQCLESSAVHTKVQKGREFFSNFEWKFNDYDSGRCLGVASDWAVPRIRHRLHHTALVNLSPSKRLDVNEEQKGVIAALALKKTRTQ